MGSKARHRPDQSGHYGREATDSTAALHPERSAACVKSKTGKAHSGGATGGVPNSS
jgi:hypothetical protein